MKYLSLFSGIGTAEKGIEQAYENTESGSTKSVSGGCSVQSTRVGANPCGTGSEQQRRVTSDYQYESTQSGQTDSKSGWFGIADERRNGILFTDHSAFRRNAECVGFAEIDKYAASIYKYHWPEVRNYGDATRIVCGELPDFDFLVGGFPCQAFSIAGKRKGFEDTRGTLFFEIARILAAKRPRHFLLENVKGLLSHDDGQTFRTIIATLDDIGYDIEWTIINSKHHGVPQNRERVFIIGHLRGECSGEVLSFGSDGSEFDGQYGQTENISSCLDANYYKGNSNGFGGLGRQTVSLPTENGIVQLNNPTHSNERVYDERGTSPTLNTAQGGQRQPFVALASRGLPRDGVNEQQLEIRDDGISNSLTSVEKDNYVMAVDYSQHGEVRITDGVMPKLASRDYKGGKGICLNDERQGNRRYDSLGVAATLASQSGGQTQDRAYLVNKRIRRLTPTECERLQGLPDGHTKYGIDDKGKTIEISDSQRYKTLGNAMTVNVIEAIVTRMIEKGCLCT